jgi:serine/threonine protein kinase
VWLDALAGGICTPEVFLSAMQEQFQGDREKSWEVLSLLDQYYRRGKIKADLFHTLKSSLESSGLKGDADASASRPPRASSTAVTSPVAAAPSTAPPAPANKTASPERAPPPPPYQAAAPAPPERAPPPPPYQAAAPASPERAPPPYQAAAPTSPERAPPPPYQAAASTAPRKTPPTLYHPALPTSPNKAAAARPETREIRELAIGDVLRGRYRIRGVLGHGGMGTVFDAIDEYRLDLPDSGQRIAIKVLHTAVTQREDLLAELQREFQNLQLLSHPNIVRVHEFDRDDDNAFFTMESLIGALLTHVLDARNGFALPRPYALALMRDVGAALAHAHSRGVVHGDINPQNIFITNDGEVRVLDFGSSHKILRNTGSSLRAPVATPGYASCQLLEGQQPDARDDLFAFACLAYLLLAGLHPFPGRTALEARARRVRPARPPGLTGRQWRVLCEGLRWERDRRPADVQKWLDRFGLAAAAPRLPPLPVLMDAPPPRKGGVAPTAAVIALMVLLAASGYWAVTNYDSLAHIFTPPTPIVTQEAQPPSMTESAPAPTESAPAPRANPTPVPRVTAPKASIPTPIAPTSTGPSAAAPTSSASSATASKPAAPSSTARTATAPIPAEPPASMPGPRAAATTARPPTSDTSARAANAGPVRVEMAADTVDVEPTDREARVTVRRRGNVHGDASFRWWTESGTAKPGRDFAPEIPRLEQIQDGRDSLSLIIPILSTPHGRSKSFYVVIDRTESGGAALGGRTLTMVTIQPTD